MKAAVLRKTGAPLAIEEVELDQPGPGMVTVRIAASGVCHTDLSIREGTIPQPTPAVLGHEAAGVVTEIGAGVDSHALGDHVVVSWVAPCRACSYCLGGQAELCEHGIDHAFAGTYGTAGGDPVWCALGTGTFAEWTVVPAAAAIRIDPDFPLDLAALVGCAVVTGVGAVVRSARVAPGESVAVLGCGGVGLSAVQGARLAGAASLVAVDRSPAALALARECGATHTVEAGDDPVAAVRDLTGGRGTDHVIECVGLSATIGQAYAMARRGGTVTIVGAGGFDDLVSFPTLSLMADAKHLQGCVYGGTDPARDIPRTIDLARTGALDLERLVTRRVGLDAVDAALDAMAAGEPGRTLVTMSEAP